MSGSKAAVVAGVGPGNGIAFARRFADDGYRVSLLARDVSKVEASAGEIDGSRGYACDVTDPGSVDRIFAI